VDPSRQADEATTADRAEEPVANSAPGSAELSSGRPVVRGSGADVRALVMRYASEHGVPYGLADAVIQIESRYNAGARNGPNVGLTQINTSTAQALGYQGPAAGLFDAETNLRYGLKYLAQAYRLAGGDTCGTILRYQAGHRAQVMTRGARAYCARVQTILAQAG
jgi:soluble lytic murein transglycosylase-like protein